MERSSLRWSIGWSPSTSPFQVSRLDRNKTINCSLPWRTTPAVCWPWMATTFHLNNSRNSWRNRRVARWFGPQTAKLPAAWQETYPGAIPPLRTDRDTVLIGLGDTSQPVDVQLTAEVQGKSQTLDWSLPATKSAAQNSFLPKLVDLARADRGLSLPTVGSAALAEVRRMMNDTTNDLGQLAKQAVATGALDQAEALAGQAEEFDPKNPDAKIVRAAVARLRAQPGAAAAPRSSGGGSAGRRAGGSERTATRATPSSRRAGGSVGARRRLSRSGRARAASSRRLVPGRSSASDQCRPAPDGRRTASGHQSA